MTTNEAGGAWDGIVPGLTLLRKPFPPNQISYLPKGGVKLAYVGHAALTDRLLDADPAWQWEPLAFGPEGLPALDAYGGMWIKLTVCGVTRLGYGHAGSKEGGDAIKEVIGDALRNAAMRFGAALDLWHKGDLHADESEPVDQPKNFGLTPARAKVVRAAANEALQKFNEGDAFAAYEAVSWIDNNVEKDALWSILGPHSTLRASLKKSAADERERQAELDAKQAAQAEIRDLSSQVRQAKAEA